MKESLDQHVGHRPAPSTGSRQVAQSCGNATSRTRARLARRTAATVPRRRTGPWLASMSPCMGTRYRPAARSSMRTIGRPRGARHSVRGSRSLPIRPRFGPQARCVRAGADPHRRARVLLKAMVSSAPDVFDRQLVRARQRRAAELASSNFLIDRVAEDLSDRLAAVLRRFECAVDLGTPTDAARRALAASGKVGAIVVADAAGVIPSAAAGCGGAEAACLVVAADAEALPFRDASLDLVVSLLALQFVNDLPGTLIQIRRALRPDGLLLAALAGGDTLIELRQAFAAAEAEIEDGVSPRVAPFSDARDMGALLQRAGF